MRKIAALLFALLPLTVLSQDFDFKPLRGNCTPPGDEETAGARGAMRRLPPPNTVWDGERTYRQLVLLVSFSDVDFTQDDPQAYYDRVFNEPGFNERKGEGCVADYFRTQSGGLLNLQFDVFGPFKVNSVARPTTEFFNGKSVFYEAMSQMIDVLPKRDFSPYDWDDDGTVNQVVFVYAGYNGNVSGFEGYIWPNTSSFTTINTKSGHKIANYTASGELWSGKITCGIGTICHEFSHSLGLPDIYPANGSAFSIVDEWDLMDGGNYTNMGWCPPNYSALEKMLLGWLTPTELTEPATITEMKAVADGGEVFIVRHSDSEYYLLENRQWKNWDKGLPGKGLVVAHVDYDKKAWSDNTVNNTSNHRRYELMHADNMDYDDWVDIVGSDYPYTEKPRLHSRILSTSAYPWETGSAETDNRELTDTSVPATTMHTKNSEGSTMLGKPITEITMSDDGLISFLFMGGAPTPPLQPGDANGDGEVNVTDVTTIISYVLGKSPADFHFEAADLNSDGIIDVTDVTMTINIILHKSE